MAARTVEVPAGPRPAYRPRSKSAEGPAFPPWTMLLACALVVIYPLREIVAGGVVAPELLQRDLSGRVVIVTGANTGIGYETARQLALQRATVVLAGRSLQRVEDAVARIKQDAPAALVTAMQLDLASFVSVQQFASSFLSRYDRLDVLVNNAGIMFAPFALTTDGFESTFAVNHLGHFLLTELLTPMMIRTGNARIVIVSSVAHEWAGRLDLDDINWKHSSYNSVTAYAWSKLANILHARALSRRLASAGVTVVSLHPGGVVTELGRHIPLVEYVAPVTDRLARIFLKSPWEGAQTTLYAVLGDDVHVNSGSYYADCVVKGSFNAAATDDALADELYTRSRAWVGLPPAGVPAVPT